MEEEDYSSDTSDDDYVPTGAASDVDEGSGDEEEGDGSENDEVKPKTSSKNSIKVVKKGKKARKGAEAEAEAEEEEASAKEEAEEKLTEEEKKAKVDNLWASFKKDVEQEVTKPKPTVAASETAAPTAPIEVKTITKEFEFAGEKVTVTEEVKVPAGSSSSSKDSGTALKRPAGRPPFRPGGGLAGLTGLLGAKKQKLSTLEKSKLDWDSFKKEEGIEEEVRTFNQGKNGFLERRDFLERTDLKQFEIERNLRQGRKSNR